VSGLIPTPGRIWLAVAPVDMRRDIDGLSMIVRQSLGQSPCAGSVFAFRNRPGNRLRLLVWDGDGVWLCHRRLHWGCFVWPKANDPCFPVSEAQWQWLVAGVDWQCLSALPQAHWQVLKRSPGFINPAIIRLTGFIGYNEAHESIRQA
jgi:transposase